MKKKFWECCHRYKLESLIDFIALTAKQLNEAFCKSYWLIAFIVSQQGVSQFKQTVSSLRRRTKWLFGRHGDREFLYDNIFEIYQSQHPLAKDSKGSIKNLLQAICSSLEIWRHSSFVSSKKVNPSRRELSSPVIICTFFSKILTRLEWVYRFNHRNSKMRLNL